VEKCTNGIIQFINTFTTQVSSWKVKKFILHFMLFKTQACEYFKKFTIVLLPRAWSLFKSPSLSTVFFHLQIIACTPNPARQSYSLFSVATGTDSLQRLIIHVMMSLQVVFERTQEVNISWCEVRTVHWMWEYWICYFYDVLNSCMFVCQALSRKWTLRKFFFSNELNEGKHSDFSVQVQEARVQSCHKFKQNPSYPKRLQPWLFITPHPSNFLPCKWNTMPFYWLLLGSEFKMVDPNSIPNDNMR
jgi:hypothetical protein